MSLHFLPFRIDYNGPAAIQQNFCDRIAEKDDVCTGVFRGREIVGKKILLEKFDSKIEIVEIVPTRSSKHMDHVDSNIEMADQKSNRVLLTKNKLQEFTYWNYDDKPSNSDDIMQILYASQVLNDIHS